MSLVELRINQYDLERIEDLKSKYENGEATTNQIKDIINIKIIQSILIEAGEDPDFKEVKKIYKHIQEPPYSSERHLTMHRLDDIGVHRYEVENTLLRREHIEDYLGVDQAPLK